MCPKAQRDLFSSRQEWLGPTARLMNSRPALLKNISRRNDCAAEVVGSSGVAVEPGVRILVPGELLHRARWLWGKREPHRSRTSISRYWRIARRLKDGLQWQFKGPVFAARSGGSWASAAVRRMRALEARTALRKVHFKRTQFARFGTGT